MHHDCQTIRALEMQAQPKNRILGSLSAEELARLHSSMQRTTLTLGQVLCEPGERPDHVYFPTSAVASSLYTMQDGAIAEIALVGNDGVVGMALILGGQTAPHREVVQIGGEAVKIPRKVIHKEFARGGLFQHALLLYTQALIMQISQTAVCNRLHTIEKRLCRWLLLCHDRVNCSEILMTQEYIANMLGSRREGVTVAAGHLQNAGVIRYSRGHIKIIDREGLEAAACECYRIVEDKLDRLGASAGRNELSA